MTNDHSHNPDMIHGSDLSAEELCIASMLRACADGELCPEGCERLKKYLAENPEAAARIEFEKKLRGCCDRVMREPECPDALRAKIQALAGAAMTASNIEASNQMTREKSFWQRSPVMSAMAAVLVIAAGAMIWQSSSLITKGSGIGVVETTPASYAERLGNFVAREHVRCCEERAAQNKLVHNEIGESIAYFSDRFEHSVTMPGSVSEQEQIRFYGGGDCHLPATVASGHMRFDAVGPDGQTVSLSLFVAPDPGLLGMEEGTTYVLDSTQCKEQGANLFAWSRDGVMYLLVSEAGEDMCASVRGMMQAPASLKRL
jgi:anti-sigma factor RsiW